MYPAIVRKNKKERKKLNRTKKSEDKEPFPEVTQPNLLYEEKRKKEEKKGGVRIRKRFPEDWGPTQPTLKKKRKNEKNKSGQETGSLRSHRLTWYTTKNQKRGQNNKQTKTVRTRTSFQMYHTPPILQYDRKTKKAKKTKTARTRNLIAIGHTHSLTCTTKHTKHIRNSENWFVIGSHQWKVKQEMKKKTNLSLCGYWINTLCSNSLKSPSKAFLSAWFLASIWVVVCLRWGGGSPYRPLLG